MRKVLLLLAGFAAFSSAAIAQVTSISVEEFYSDDGTVSGYPQNFTTYRIYANCTNANDVVSAVVGHNQFPISININGGVWNHPAGGVLGSTIDCNQYGQTPALEYDSYVTIGRTCNTDPGSTVYSVEDAAQPWEEEVFNTVPLGASTLTINSLVGASWFGFPGDPNCVAGGDLKVLIAQITTDGPICGVLNLEVFPQYQGIGDEEVVQTGLTFGTVNCGNPGCTDPGALNFDEDAGYDDGYCLYPCDLDFDVTAINPTCAGDTDGSLIFQAIGAQGLVQYTFNGEDDGFVPDLHENLGDGTYTLGMRDTQFDDELFNPGGIYGECVATTEVSLLTLPIVPGALSVTNVTCNGDADGCVSTSATGGTGTLTYSVWTCANSLIADNLTEPSYCGLGGGSYKMNVTDENGCTVSTSCSQLVNPSTLNLILGNAVDATCANSPNGIQVVTWGGGTGDVDFSLENDDVYDIEGNFSNVVLNTLLPGQYTLYGSDSNGCTDDITFTVDGPPAIVLSGMVVDPTCQGLQNGSVTVSATGGTGALTYSPNGLNYFPTGAFTNLASGTYTFYAKDANACVISQEFTVNDPTPISSEVEAQGISCNGEQDASITINATGGTSPYTYSIDGESYQQSNVFENLVGDEYSIFVKDANGCLHINDSPVSITEPQTLELSAEVSDISCFGEGDGSIVLTASGGTLDYLFSIGELFGSESSFTDLEAGSYTATVLDANGCEASIELSISEPEALTVAGLSANPIDETPGGNNSYFVTGGTPPYYYDWTNEQGDLVSTDMDLPDLTEASDAGTYTLVVTDSNGCSDVAVIVITGINEIADNVSVLLMPNPTRENATLVMSGLNGGKLSYQILDTQGRMVMRKELGNAGGTRTESLNLEHIAAGMYYLNVRIGEQTETLKLIKE